MTTRLSTYLPLAAIGLTLCSVGAHAADYCVATSGKDSNRGTYPKSCWATAQNAANKVDPGDTVCFMAGIHEGMGIKRSGSERQPITWERCPGVGPGRVSLVAQKRQKRGVIEVKSGVRYHIVDGLDFHESLAGSGVGGVWMAGGNDGWIVRYTRFIGKRKSGAELSRIAASRGRNGTNNRDGLWRLKGNGIKFHNNYGRYWPYSFVRESEGTKGLLFTENDLAYSSAKIIAVDRSCEGSSELLTGNTYYRNYIGQSWTGDGWHINGRKACKGGYHIIANVFYANAENGIDAKGLGNSVIEGNLFAAHAADSNGPKDGYNRGCGGAVTTGSGAQSANILVRNNVFFDNASAINVKRNSSIYNNTVINNTRTGRGVNLKNECSVQGIGSAGHTAAVVNNVTVTPGAALSHAGARDQILDGNVYAAGGKYRGRVRGKWRIVEGLKEWRSLLEDGGYRGIVGKEANSIETRASSALRRGSMYNATLGHPFTSVDLRKVLSIGGNLQVSSKYGSGGEPIAFVKRASTGNRVSVGSQWTSFCCRWDAPAGYPGKDRVLINGKRYQIVAIDARKGELILNSSVRVKAGNGIDVVYIDGRNSRQRGSHGYWDGKSTRTYKPIGGL